MDKLLGHIAQLSQEIVIPQTFGESSVNTSPDDVTMIGIEIETDDEAIVKTFYPQKTKEITLFIKEFIHDIFSNKNAVPYAQMKNRFSMILEEGLINAWRHGNKKDSTKPITLIFKQHNDFVFEIVDQGDGFDYNNRPDPTSTQNIEKSSGRGLFIIEHFADQIIWHNNGRHIVICLKKSKTLDNRDLNKKTRLETHLWKKVI